MLNTLTINHAQMFCGLGGGARGMNRGRAQVGNTRAKFQCIGGIDVDPAAVRDFERLSGVPGTLLDLMDREQYRAFHGCEPPADWRMAGPEDVRRAFGYLHPHILFLSPPCKGFSGLLSSAKSKSIKYQALNMLTVRGIMLALEAYRDDPIELIMLENVPRIATRGRHLLDQIVALLRAYGYATAETTHDCGELGGLAQTRKRFLLVARHKEKVPSFLYQPLKRPLRSVGSLLERMPVPGLVGPDGLPLGGAMHRVPRLQWKTWVRLAFIEAGKDWRSLNRLAVEDGHLRDYGILPAGSWRDDIYGVLPWDSHSMTVTGKSSPSNGRYAVADPRYAGQDYSQYGVLPWNETAGTLSGQSAVGGGKYSVADPRRPGESFGKYAVTDFDAPAGTVISGSTTGQGCFAVADPRTGYSERAHHNLFRIVDWSKHSGTITGASHVAGSALSVADPRYTGIHHNNVYRVVPFEDKAGTVTTGGHPSSGGQCVADPRPWSGERTGYNGSHYGVLAWDETGKTVTGCGAPDNSFGSVADPRPGWGRDKTNFLRGHYGVVAWEESCKTVAGSACFDNGYFSVADPRGPVLPALNEQCVAVIQALDGTWHRPFTTLELAVLQNLIDPEEQLELDGLSDSAWRERIGNAVPPAAAEAMASVMGEVLLLTWLGETFSMSSQPIWVRPVAAALMSAQEEYDVA